ncbi:DUF2332 domain-containing protein [Paracoccus spongiarum]|uniref:DUF2332 family protein n=1 Tax=Paracoccus spongiarum TaxID=3064387 RepID=A0ABT9J7F3_9RHOB|nr:DUF2332 family protein [Paracoccus sp. 2205BS29-5]MDP5305736.1 DUF2332 family protein [Paracoccus sp. 2205BS29-5]
MTQAAIRAAFRGQAEACRSLGSPFTAALCEMLADALWPGGGAVADRVLGWQGDPTGRGDSLPLRLCGALHALVLRETDPALAAAWQARQPDPAVVLAALSRHEAEILAWLDSPPQTNEVARAAAVIGAARFLAARLPLPLRVLELGASAGLNLNFARYYLLPGPDAPLPADAVRLTPDWSGTLPDAPLRVAETRGVDLRPVDARRDGLRLMAYCWADQTERMQRLRAALAVARAHPPQVDAGDAGVWLAHRLAIAAPGRLTLVFHTIAAQYFPPATRQQVAAALTRAAAVAGPRAPLAHFAMEADGGTGAALRLSLWDGSCEAWDLGRADFHGRWIDWRPRRV